MNLKENNKKIYIATFFSHFGALRFKKDCEMENLKVEIMPVPRDLSSSCGTCVKFEKENLAKKDIKHSDEIEQIVQVTKEGYKSIYKAENS
ncbi:DUF3343 domain-containing protein [Eubacterium multiforme]|uniref:Putative Se/S carrier protein-like domain-containing protein n=1 Tax=Eubacterium multiforme TaxID=83339 RepID=A0ABT9UV40_9FIRM|nr:DUF3343 domain-containing protein [Eubacterium multiforme]MDQ0150182.1 hypothetical protein [Eubacterium multiforme]